MLRLAVRAASRARHRCHRHAAILHRGGNIVALAVNHDEVHAEVAALRSLWPSERVGCRALVIRLGRSGALRLSKPCAACEAAMRSAGIRSVTYSDGNGALITERL